LLNDLVAKLLLLSRAGGKTVWKERMQVALGGEGPLLATLVPKIGILMDLPGFGNSPQLFRPAPSGPTTSPQKSLHPKNNTQRPSQHQLPPDPRVQFITQWDWNMPQRFQRLCLAVRDLIQAVAEYTPVVMIIDNLQALDEDSWSLLYT
jgi:predicted ATPase